MTRHIRIREPNSGLNARCLLLDELAPANAQLLWDLCGEDTAYAASHAIWTGPEISCPISAGAARPGFDVRAVPSENATSFPAAGDIVLVCAPEGTWKDGPPFDLIDIGLFYGSGGRMLMPFGWIMANVCARIEPEALADAQAACRRIRQAGACHLTLVRDA